MTSVFMVSRLCKYVVNLDWMLSILCTVGDRTDLISHRTSACSISNSRWMWSGLWGNPVLWSFPFAFLLCSPSVVIVWVRLSVRSENFHCIMFLISPQILEAVVHHCFQILLRDTYYFHGLQQFHQCRGLLLILASGEGSVYAWALTGNIHTQERIWVEWMLFEFLIVFLVYWV